jgi:hypothetical protein
MRLDEVLGGSNDNVNTNDGQAGQFIPSGGGKDEPKDQNALSINRSKKRARFAAKGMKLRRERRSRKEEMEMSPNIAKDDTGQTDRMVRDFYNK